MIGLLLVLAVQTRTEVVAREAPSTPIHVECPVNRTTRIVFPEPMKQLKGLGSEKAPLGLAVAETKPLGVIVVSPVAHPTRGRIEFRGPTAVIRIDLTSAPDGDDSEVRLVMEGRPRPSIATLPASAEAPGEKTSAAPPPPEPDRPRAPGPSPGMESKPPARPTAPTLDLEGLLRATPVTIDRREGLPGQPEMVLVDALRGDEWVWLRFRLEGGAMSRIESVTWEHGEVSSFVQEPAGRDLRVIVQMPRAPMTKKTRVSLLVAGGPSYRFALTARTLTALFRGLLQ